MVQPSTCQLSWLRSQRLRYRCDAPEVQRIEGTNLWVAAFSFRTGDPTFEAFTFYIEFTATGDNADIRRAMDEALAKAGRTIYRADWNLLPDYEDRIVPALRESFNDTYDISLMEGFWDWLTGTGPRDQYRDQEYYRNESSGGGFALPSLVRRVSVGVR